MPAPIMTEVLVQLVIAAITTWPRSRVVSVRRPGYQAAREEPRKRQRPARSRDLEQMYRGRVVVATVRSVSEPLRLTVAYEGPDEAGYIMAWVPEVPGAHGQGATRGEARSEAIEALHFMLEGRFEQERKMIPEAHDSEPLHLVISA
jgi:predicted RNase H-like HicB family nuclease